MKNANTEDPGASTRVIVGITAGNEFTSAPSDRGAHVNSAGAMLWPWRGSKPNSRLGALLNLVALFTDSNEFDMRCSHKLLAAEGYSPRSLCASRAAAELVQVAAIANLAST